jgi:hypothetical protein
MITPAEIKFELEQKLHELAKDGEPPMIIGIHSVCMSDSETAYAIFDIRPDPDGHGLHFEFQLPSGVHTPDDLRDFSRWLASEDFTGAIH